VLELALHKVAKEVFSKWMKLKEMNAEYAEVLARKSGLS
jgi:hypothetical protein